MFVLAGSLSEHGERGGTGKGTAPDSRLDGCEFEEWDARRKNLSELLLVYHTEGGLLFHLKPNAPVGISHLERHLEGV